MVAMNTRVDKLLEEYEAQNGEKRLDEKVYVAYDCCDCDCCDCDCCSDCDCNFCC